MVTVVVKFLVTPTPATEVPIPKLKVTEPELQLTKLEQLVIETIFSFNFLSIDPEVEAILSPVTQLIIVPKPSVTLVKPTDKWLVPQTTSPSLLNKFLLNSPNIRFPLVDNLEIASLWFCTFIICKSDPVTTNITTPTDDTTTIISIKVKPNLFNLDFIKTTD